MMASIMGAGKVLALEPDPAAFEELWANVRLNPELVGSKAHVYRHCASDRVEKATITSVVGSTSWMLDGWDAASAAPGEVEAPWTVHCSPISAIAAAHGRTGLHRDAGRHAAAGHQQLRHRLAGDVLHVVPGEQPDHRERREQKILAETGRIEDLPQPHVGPISRRSTPQRQHASLIRQHQRQGEDKARQRRPRRLPVALDVGSRFSADFSAVGRLVRPVVSGIPIGSERLQQFVQRTVHIIPLVRIVA
jgi:FkbM family methyltransferase